MRRLVPTPVTDDLDVDALAAHYTYPEQGAVRANMVTSVDGAVTIDGRSEGISNAIDWRLFGLQRALADVVVVGAGTARTEGYGPTRARPEFAHLRTAAGQPPAPRLALVTASGDLDPASDFFGGSTPTLVITHRGLPDGVLARLREVAEVLLCGDAEVDLAVACEALRDRGLHRVLTEGGPHLLGALTADDLLDEVALTVTPGVVGGESPRMIASASAAHRSLGLAGVLDHEGTLFLHYRRDRA
jgi:riboflavin biosynthesis pyrimidine reductase